MKAIINLKNELSFLEGSRIEPWLNEDCKFFGTVMLFLCEAPLVSTQAIVMAYSASTTFVECH
jgi:hypothetical protein